MLTDRPSYYAAPFANLLPTNAPAGDHRPERRATLARAVPYLGPTQPHDDAVPASRIDCGDPVALAAPIGDNRPARIAALARARRTAAPSLPGLDARDPAYRAAVLRGIERGIREACAALAAAP